MKIVKVSGGSKSPTPSQFGFQFVYPKLQAVPALTGCRNYRVMWGYAFSLRGLEVVQCSSTILSVDYATTLRNYYTSIG